MADLTDARIDELVKWTVDSRNVDMCAIHTALKELVWLRAARGADEERVRSVVAGEARIALYEHMSSYDVESMDYAADAMSTRVELPSHPTSMGDVWTGMTGPAGSCDPEICDPACPKGQPATAVIRGLLSLGSSGVISDHPDLVAARAWIASLATRSAP